MDGFVVWFTGLSGAGKSTLAAMLAAELTLQGVRVEVLDGDEVRTHLSKGLGFSREDRDTNVRRIGFVAKLVARAGACAITAAISPYRAVRDEQRAKIGRFVEVFVQCSIPVLAERDAKGLYRKALAGEIKHFTGIDDPYEAPERPEITVDTAIETKEQSLARIVERLVELGYVGPTTHDRSARALVAPHGGELVDRFVQPSERERWLDLARGLPAIDLDDRAERDLTLIANGALSPLKGPLGSKDYLRVVREMRLENGLVWPIPIVLAASIDRGAIGSRVALRARDGRLVAVLDVTDVWTPDKDLEAREVHGTTDLAHPGVAALRDRGETCVGGEIHVFDRPIPRSPHALDPRDARETLTRRGASRVAGLRVRGPMLRAHEHLLRTALEISDGAILFAPDGDARIRAHEALISSYFPVDRVLVTTDPSSPRWAGPREALLHLVTGKSFGVSRFVIGRDHASVGRFYGPHDAQRICDAFSPAELGAEALSFEDAFWSEAVGSMATRKTAPDAPDTLVSPAAIDAMLARGEAPPPEIMRPEVAAVLLADRVADRAR
jgi:ATP sulfurylase/adenylyl-sulfate kinase